MAYKKANSTERDNTEMAPKKKKVCMFCETKTIPAYTDVFSLRKFTSTRGKIVPKQRSGVCSKHQRGLAKEVKHARHLALLPFMLNI